MRPRVLMTAAVETLVYHRGSLYGMTRTSTAAMGRQSKWLYLVTGHVLGMTTMVEDLSVETQQVKWFAINILITLTWHDIICVLDATCILSVMEHSYFGKVYCCGSKILGKNEKCDGCDLTSLPCKPNTPGNSQQECLDVLKWCDGVIHCKVKTLLVFTKYLFSLP